jgi:hypothetical protein
MYWIPPNYVCHEICIFLDTLFNFLFFFFDQLRLRLMDVVAEVHAKIAREKNPKKKKKRKNL